MYLPAWNTLMKHHERCRESETLIPGVDTLDIQIARQEDGTMILFCINCGNELLPW